MLLIKTIVDFINILLHPICFYWQTVKPKKKKINMVNLVLLSWQGQWKPNLVRSKDPLLALVYDVVATVL